ncbi:unnamed protein product [Linum tenue]|uniref:Uncharacterized protein n=1 Tax=Linum tenue TaxID=586396 RepID=A0AAV0JAS5_9ROSI|nr:unnamed protein product [Linum tenue]
MAFSSAILLPSLSSFTSSCDKNTIRRRRHGGLKPMVQCCSGLGENHARKLKEAKHLFTKKTVAKDEEVLVMIDAVQRLGIDYHFQEDIEAVLNDELGAAKMAAEGGGLEDGLFRVCLSFRLLRQQDVFNKLMNREGKFLSRFGHQQHVQSLMQLYEASQWLTPAEHILHEAREFSARRLRSWTAAANPSQYDPLGQLATRKSVANTLKHPCHRSMPRLAIKDYLSSFRAALITNKRQSYYYVETLKDLALWWDEVGLAANVGRDRLLVKASAWPMATLSGSEFSECRIELAKIIAIVYLIDDIFDTYGSLEELTVFAEAVTRWDTDTVEKLPEIMRTCFVALYHTTNQIGYQVYRKHGWNPMHSLKQAWAKLFEAFLVEARWLRTKECPKSDDYLKTGIVTSGVPLLLVHFFFMLGKGLTGQNVGLVDGDEPPLISSVAKILRLSDDLSSMINKCKTNLMNRSIEYLFSQLYYEEQVGYDGSYVDCYMKENPGVSVHEATRHVTDMIEDTWKQLNREYLSPAVPLPTAFGKAVVDSAKMVPLMYGNGVVDDDDQEYSNIDRSPSLQKNAYYSQLCT